MLSIREVDNDKVKTLLAHCNWLKALGDMWALFTLSINVCVALLEVIYEMRLITARTPDAVLLLASVQKILIGCYVMLCYQMHSLLWLFVNYHDLILTPCLMLLNFTVLHYPLLYNVHEVAYYLESGVFINSMAIVLATVVYVCYFKCADPPSALRKVVAELQTNMVRLWPGVQFSPGRQASIKEDVEVVLYGLEIAYYTAIVPFMTCNFINVFPIIMENRQGRQEVLALMVSLLIFTGLSASNIAALFPIHGRRNDLPCARSLLVSGQVISILKAGILGIVLPDFRSLYAFEGLLLLARLLLGIYLLLEAAPDALVPIAVNTDDSIQMT